MDKVCQSCGMPMKDESKFGTNSDGSKNGEYCCFCFHDGEFTFNGSYDEFFKKQVAIAKKMIGLSKEKAKEMANKVLPNLRRWKGNL